jgi:predicted nucleic acid-binding protein
MPSFVLDASVALSWFFDDESDALAEYIYALTDEHAVAVPYHWPAEVANGMIIGERRGRATPEWTGRFAASLENLALRVEDCPADGRAFALMPLAREHRLSIYDALYFDLAQRLSLPLATLDGPLARAAKLANLPLIELP